MAECKLCLSCVHVGIQVCNTLTEGSNGDTTAPVNWYHAHGPPGCQGGQEQSLASTDRKGQAHAADMANHWPSGSHLDEMRHQDWSDDGAGSVQVDA